MDGFYFTTKGLTVGYHGVPLIRDIAIHLKKGEILTLIGPNGVGKTTILRNIIRQLEPISGMVCLDGTELRNLTGQALSQKLSVVLTERARPELMSCAEVVATGRYPYTGRFGVLSPEDRRIVAESMELVHITELAERDFNRISDGQKQRVMLARALCQEPEIIVLDEPTSFLDIRYKLEFLSILQRMSRTKNLSVIMSLHELDLAGRISDQIVCIKGDTVDRFGPPEEIFTPGYIPSLYGMTVGAYDERTGNLELAPASGTPEVFIIGGNGTATPLYRKLQRENIPFATGILWENDLDYPVARMLAGTVIRETAFHNIRESTFAQAKQAMDACRTVYCTVDTASCSDLARPLAELSHYAAAQHKLQPNPITSR